jgi:2-iminobutanoate/2-iminopropanoate deaminase
MKLFAALQILLLVVFSAITDASADSRTYVRPSAASGDGLPFSGAVKAGDTLYVSGDIGLTEDRKVPEDPKEEARLLMESFQGTLAEAGYSMDDLVYVTVYCSDVKHYSDFNEVYQKYFTKNFPARAFVGAGTLLFDARFEMPGIAVKQSD